MKVAFHFNAHHASLEGTLYHLPIQKKCFQLLLAGDTDQLHLKIYTGDLLTRTFARDQEHLEELISGLLNPPYPVWQALRPDFYDIILTHRIYVMAFEGMSRKTRDSLNSSLWNYEPYFGAQQVHEANLCHWGVYNQGLMPRYRMLERELRLLYYSTDEDYGRDEELADRWRDLFSRVTFEDLGIRHTIFDSYNSYEHARRVADLSEMLGDHLAVLSDELLMRLEDGVFCISPENIHFRIIHSGSV